MKKTFLEKLFEFDAYMNQKQAKKKVVEEKEFKMPLIKLVCSPFNYLIDFFKKTIPLCLIYSAIITIVSVIMGFTFLCMIPEIQSTTLHCSRSTALYIFYSLIKVFIFSGFIINYYNIISERGFSYKDILKIDSRILKVFGGTMVFMMLNVIPLLSLQILIARVPNPNWRIETLFFTVVSIGFLTPFVAMRLYSVFGYLVETGKIASIKDIWKKTRGNGFKIIISLFFIIFFGILLIGSYYGNFQAAFDSNSIVLSSITSELVYNIIILILLGIFVGHIYIQRLILIENEANKE